MRKQISKIVLTVGFVLALAFTISCGEHNFFDNELSSSSADNPSSSNIAISSSNTLSSSSSIGISSLGSSSSSDNSSSSICSAADNTDTQYCSLVTPKTYSPYLPIATMKTYGSTPVIGGRTYKTVEIGDQVWMAENLNYAVEGSKCYAEGISGVSQDSIAKNCAQYGRLYDWATAMDLPSDCNSSYCTSQIGIKHKGICPTGWHIPSDAEWDTLKTNTYGGKYLKATSGWLDCGPGGSGKTYSSCEDLFGFSALPGSHSYSNSINIIIGNWGYWWSTTETKGVGPDMDGPGAYYRYMAPSEEAILRYSTYKKYGFSIRCLQD